jgi:hypothetical protein
MSDLRSAVNAKDNLADLAALLREPTELEAATVARPPRGSDVPEVRVLSLASDAEDFFRGVIHERVESKLDPLVWTLKKLDPLYKPDPGEVEWERTQEIDPLLYAIGKLENLSAVAPFDQSDEQYKQRLLYWAVALTASDGRRVFFFRSFTAAAELKRKRGAALVSQNGSFTRVESAIFLFDDDIDCFVYGDYTYVVRKRDFRRIFDQMAAVLRRAKAAARDLHGKVPIANFNDFENACGSDSRLADKVLAVRGRDYFDDLSFSMLEPVIEEFDLDVPTQTVGDEPQLVFRTEPDQRFRILKLVDDDFLRSTMTNHRYEVNSKSDAAAD